ncbi:hypothetical protein MXB_3915, partial [Myxobolus squamalis]
MSSNTLPSGQNYANSGSTVSPSNNYGNSNRSENGATVSAAAHILPKKSYIPPPTVPENRALFRVFIISNILFLSGRNSTASRVCGPGRCFTCTTLGQRHTKVDEKTRYNLDRYQREQREFIKSRIKPGDLSETEQIANSRKIEDDRVKAELHELLKGHIVFRKFSYA